MLIMGSGTDLGWVNKAVIEDQNCFSFVFSFYLLRNVVNWVVLVGLDALSILEYVIHSSNECFIPGHLSIHL